MEMLGGAPKKAHTESAGIDELALPPGRVEVGVLHLRCVLCAVILVVEHSAEVATFLVEGAAHPTRGGFLDESRPVKVLPVLFADESAGEAASRR